MLQHVGFMYTLKLSVPQTHAIWRISEVLPTGEDKASNLRKFIEGNLYKIDKVFLTTELTLINTVLMTHVKIA